MKQKVRKKRQRRKRNAWIASIAALVAVAFLSVWGIYFRDTARIGDHVPARCALMLTANERWTGVRKLPQWSYVVERYGRDMPWLATADAVSTVRETLLLSLIGDEVRLVLCRDDGSDTSAIYLVKLSRLGKFADLLARLLRRVRVESHNGVSLRRLDGAQPFYYTVLGRILIGGQSRHGIVEAAALSEEGRLVEPQAFAQMERNNKIPWAALYCNMERSPATAEAGFFSSLYAVLHMEQDGLQARLEAPFHSQFRDRAAEFVEKMQPRTMRTSTRMPASIIAGLSLCGSVPFGEILDSAGSTFGVPQLSPRNWGSLTEGRGATLAASCGALLAQFVEALDNEATVALTNVDTYEIVPTPEFILFGEAKEGAQVGFLDRLEQTAESVGEDRSPLQRKSMKGVETAYLDLPEGRSLQLCMAAIGSMLAMTTSEYALGTLLDTSLGNTPSIKMTEPDLIAPEHGANAIVLFNIQRLIETSEDLFELLLEYDLLVNMDRQKYDQKVSPVLGLAKLFRSVGVSLFLDGQSVKGEVRIPFARI